MLSNSAFVAAIAITTATSSCLTAQQSIAIDGNSGAFTSRSSLGTGAGELLQGFPAAHYRGVGEQAGGCIVQGIRLVIQDQDGLTPADYDLVLRDGTDSGGPASEIVRVGPLNVPPGGGGASAWRVSTSFQAPVQLPGCDQFFAAGIDVRAAPNWVTDGLSTRIDVSRRAHSRGVSHSWVWTAAGATRLATLDSWTLELLTDASVLQLGTGVGSGSVAGQYGLGGIFPDTGSDISARARFDPATFNGGVCALWLGTWRQSGTPLFPGTAQLYLAGTFVPAGRRAIDANGQAEMTIARNIPAVVVGAGLFHFQAAGFNGTTVGLSNTFTILP